MMFNLDGIEVFFPYEFIYPEQLKYMKEIRDALRGEGHCLIEMPSGTGKTIALLSIAVSHQLHMKDAGKAFPRIVYCSRTVSEIEKALTELKILVKYIGMCRKASFLGLGLSARKNLCINDMALLSGDVDTACRRMTSDWNLSKCDFYEGAAGETEIPLGVYNLEDIRKLGKERGVCPYFLVRKLVPHCDCIIYTYNYLIDPHIADVVSKNIPSNAIVIFDEAHNIDNVCIETLSIEVKRNTLENATKALKRIEKRVLEVRKEQKQILADEGARLKERLREKTDESISYLYNSNHEYEYVPGNIRNTIHFVSVLKRLNEFFKTKLKTTHLTTETPVSFCKSIKDLTFIDRKTLKFSSQRLRMMIRTVFLEEDEDLNSLKRIVDFSTMAGLNNDGFCVIFEPFDTQAPSVFNPVLRLWCLDSSIAMKHVFSKFRNVVVTSGTLSPIDIYPKILNFAPVKTAEISATLTRNSISPLIVSKGNDQITLRAQPDPERGLGVLEVSDKNVLTSTFSLRSEPSVVRNYGTLVLELSRVTPDGMVVFFPSYIYMEEIVSLWSESAFITEIMKNKLVFIETPDFKETSMALENYKRACDSGRGGVLFSVARGKVSEGVDFQDGYGRCVVMLGVPFQYTESIRLKKRLEFLKARYGIREFDFLSFDAMRQAAQCLGRVLRNKEDYGLMVLADRRFERADKRNKLPKWIQSFLEIGNCNLSIDMAVNIGKHFFKEMAQQTEGIGHSLLSEHDLKAKL